VAAGDGALSTCTARPARRITKSSSSWPSRPMAWARTPAGAGTRSARRSSGTRRLAAAAKRRSTQGARHLLDPEPPVVPREPPEPRNRNVAAEVVQVDATPLVALACEREHRVGTDVHRAWMPRGEVDAEETDRPGRPPDRRGRGPGRRAQARSRGTRRGTRSPGRRPPPRVRSRRGPPRRRADRRTSPPGGPRWARWKSRPRCRRASRGRRGASSRGGGRAPAAAISPASDRQTSA